MRPFLFWQSIIYVFFLSVINSFVKQKMSHVNFRNDSVLF